MEWARRACCVRKAAGEARPAGSCHAPRAPAPRGTHRVSDVKRVGQGGRAAMASAAPPAGSPQPAHDVSGFFVFSLIIICSPPLKSTVRRGTPQTAGVRRLRASLALGTDQLRQKGLDHLFVQLVAHCTAATPPHVRLVRLRTATELPLSGALLVHSGLVLRCMASARSGVTTSTRRRSEGAWQGTTPALLCVSVTQARARAPGRLALARQMRACHTRAAT